MCVFIHITSGFVKHISAIIGVGNHDYWESSDECNDCPSRAISYGDKIMYNDNQKWWLDLERVNGALQVPQRSKSNKICSRLPGTIGKKG